MPRRLMSVLAVVALPLALAACSSGGGTSPTASPTSSSASPTASPTGTSSPTASPTDTSSPAPTGSPSTVTPSPIVGVDSITVIYNPTTAPADTKVVIVGTTNKALAGKPAYILKLNDGGPRLLATGSSVNANGEISSYVQLLRTGVLQIVVPKTPLTLGAADSVGTYPWDPNTPLLAQSGQFTVTITK